MLGGTRNILLNLDAAGSRAFEVTNEALDDGGSIFVGDVSTRNIHDGTAQAYVDRCGVIGSSLLPE